MATQPTTEKGPQTETRQPAIPVYPIIVDPGHGGAPSAKRLDKWDPRTGKYLGRYLFGGVYKHYREHKIVLPLAERLHYYLRLTETAEGWQKFEKLLRQFSTQKNFERIQLQSHLTRTHSYSDFNYPKNDPRNHRPYLLHDYPVQGRMQKGRLSFINSKKPYMVISLHMTPAGRSSPGGMAGVLSPGYDTFNMLRKISLGQLSQSHFKRSRWYKGWLVTDQGWSRYYAGRSDAWVYFHGFRTRGGKALQRWPSMNRGLRYNMQTWRYADPPGWEKLARLNEAGPYSTAHRHFRATGKFWDRERAQPERWRREGGAMGYGGDNHKATDEMMRYVQYGARLQSSALRQKGAIGPIHRPYISAYTLPIYTNAIVAFLEIAYINRSNDRRLITQYRDVVARSLAVGTYAMFRRIKLKPGHGPYRPRGIPIDWARYEKYEKGNYFKLAAAP